MTGETRQTIVEHLMELRKRVIHSIVGVLIGFLLVYHFAERLFDILLIPLCRAFKRTHCPIAYTSVVEPFLVYLKVGLLGGTLLAVPWVFYQIWLFISPGLKPNERKYVVPFVIVASLMFLVGGGIGYFFLFPYAFDFFVSVAPESIFPMISMSDYFSLASGLLIAFGLLFEIPVFIVLLNLLGVIKAKSLWKTWRIAVAGIFIVAAILTPADPYTLLLLGIPLSLFYMSALVLCSFLEKVRSR